jgi:hypothetical protein
MKADVFIRDAVCQLNLLLWMAKEQPPDAYRVRPFFFEHNFQLVYIGQPFRFPEETVHKLDETRLEISRSPEPELLLARSVDNKACYFEAKSNSFGIGSSNSKQARGHLIATGPIFEEVLSPLKFCLLCYLVPDSAKSQMSECLTDLSEELIESDFQPGAFSVHGLSVEKQQVIYCWDAAFKDFLNISEDFVPILDGVDDETDPTPLILIFSDEDCSTSEMRDLYRRAVLDQVRARVLCNLQEIALNYEYRLSTDDLLTQVSDGLFQFWGRQHQKGLRSLVRERFFNVIYDSWKSKQPGIQVLGDTLTVMWSTADDREAFMEWLEDRKVKFEAGPPANRNFSLFDLLPDSLDKKY